MKSGCSQAPFILLALSIVAVLGATGYLPEALFFIESTARGLSISSVTIAISAFWTVKSFWIKDDVKSDQERIDLIADSIAEDLFSCMESIERLHEMSLLFGLYKSGIERGVVEKFVADLESHCVRHADRRGIIANTLRFIPEESRDIIDTHIVNYFSAIRGVEFELKKVIVEFRAALVSGDSKLMNIQNMERVVTQFENVTQGSIKLINTWYWYYKLLADQYRYWSRGWKRHFLPSWRTFTEISIVRQHNLEFLEKIKSYSAL